MRSSACIPENTSSPSGEIELNAGRAVASVMIRNTGDRPVQVGSHYHFFEVNQRVGI